MFLRAACVGGALLVLLGQSLRAQAAEDRRVGIFLDYALTGVEGPGESGGRLTFQGLELGGYVAQNSWLRWRADLTAGGSAGLLGPSDAYELVGPEFTKRAGRAEFFAHSLFGHGEVDGGLFNPNGSGFAMAFGGGVDLRLSYRFSIRLIDADYLPSHFTGPVSGVSFGGPPPASVTSWGNNSRVSFGLIVKFGPKH